MKSHTYYHTFRTSKAREYINITDIVEDQLAESGVQEGLILVSAMHITAAVYVNDAESGIIQDIDEMLDRLAPKGPDYRHHRTGEVNGDAHLKNILMHHQVMIPVDDLSYYRRFSCHGPAHVLRNLPGKSRSAAFTVR